MPLRKKNKSKADEKTSQDKSITVRTELSPVADMLINIGNCQDQGARERQEDSFGYSNITDTEVINKKGILAVLSDGMGGLSNGKEVSEYVVQAVNAAFAADDFSIAPRAKLESMLKTINRTIYKRFSDGVRSTAGATAVVVYIRKNILFWATVGDSRVYCVRNDNLFALNEDHDYKNELYRKHINGALTRMEAESDPQRDNLVSFIGKAGDPKIDVCVRGYQIKPDDTYILCSDGIYNGINLEIMKEIILGSNAQQASERIVKTISDNKLPGQDNMTVMVIKCTKGKKGSAEAVG